jgi:gamma-butyrobetaine dioxygenase
MTGGTTGPLEVIAALFDGPGARDYFGEAVSVATHMLLAAGLAEAAAAPGPLIAAALLHDVGHFTGTVTGRDLMQGTDNNHSDQGANWLAQWFGPDVTEPVRLHVAAKRYLCATEPGYFARLSPASVYTLTVQGGPMQGEEIGEFEASPFALQACQVRRWDDEAKDPGARVAEFEHYVPVLAALLQ